MRSVRAAAPWAALTALLLAPVAGVVALAETGREVPQQLDPRAVAVLTEPTVTTGDDPVDAVAHVQLGTAPSLASRGGSGIVTAIVAKPGDRLRSGDAVYAVDGVRKYAMASETPPYRDLVVGSQGADVLAAERFLKAAGAFDHTPDDSFDRASAAAAHAVGVRSGARDPGWSFTPEMVVWLPGEGFRVGSVELALGRSEPAAGETIVTGLAPVTAVRITDGQGQALSVTWPRVVSLAGKDLGSVGDPAAIPAKIARMRLGDARRPVAVTVLNISTRVREPGAWVLEAVPPGGTIAECWVEFTPGAGPTADVIAAWLRTSSQPIVVTSLLEDDRLRQSPGAQYLARPTRLAWLAAGAVLGLGYAVVLWFRRAEVALYRTVGMSRPATALVHAGHYAFVLVLGTLAGSGFGIIAVTRGHTLTAEAAMAAARQAAGVGLTGWVITLTAALALSLGRISAFIRDRL